MDAHVGAAGERPLCELASALRNRRIVPAAMSVAQTFGEFRAEQENLRRLIDPSQQDHQLRNDNARIICAAGLARVQATLPALRGWDRSRAICAAGCGAPNR